MTSHTPQHPATAHARRAPVWLAISLMGGGLLTACAGMPPPTEQLAVSTAAVASATSAGAPELASAELSTARDKLARANAAVAADQNERALQLARESQVDARLAEVKARAAKAQTAANELSESNRVLRVEIERATQ